MNFIILTQMTCALGFSELKVISYFTCNISKVLRVANHKMKYSFLILQIKYIILNIYILVLIYFNTHDFMDS